MGIRASASAKIILFGEHAVVYGKPALATPIPNLRVYVDIAPSSSAGITILLEALSQTFHIHSIDEPSSNPIAETVRLTLQQCATPLPQCEIHIISDIPIASGLGSGAAISTAIARALSIFLKKPLDEIILNKIVYEVEKIYHGTPSGIDNTTIVYEQPIYYVAGEFERLTVSRPLHFVIGDTGKRSLTKDAVADVRVLYELQRETIQPILDDIGDLTDQAKDLLLSGDEIGLGKLMNKNHERLQQLTVSSPELDQLCNAANNAGALGAKLSGGGRGGNMIALVKPETQDKVRQTLLKHGAMKTYISTIT